MPQLTELAALIAQVTLLAGVTLLVLSALGVIPAVLRVSRRSRSLRTALELAQRDGEDIAAGYQARFAETVALLEPWRRLLRWGRHPLVGATAAWYLRRRRAGR